MKSAIRSATASLFASALVFGAASLAPAAAAPPGGPAGHDYALWPPIPRIPIKPPRFPIGGDFHVPGGITEFSELPSLGQTINVARLFGKAAVSKDEQAVAKAACRAMQLGFLGTGQRGYWENAILENVDEEAYDRPFAEVAINVAAERAASAISAAQYGEGLFKFYLDTCYLKRLG